MTTFCFVFYEAYLSPGRRMQRRKREGEYNVLYRRQLGGKRCQGKRKRKKRKKTGSRMQVEDVPK
jgi:hypothetical protein